MKPLKSPAVLIFVGFGLSACTAPDYQSWPPINFKQSAPLSMAVSEVVTVSAFQSSYDLPRVENEMPVNPDATLQRWANDRVAATGERTATLTYTVTDAKVVASALETDQTLKAWFTDEQAVRYEVTLAATVEINDPAAGAAGMAEAAAQRSTTVPENATLNVREEALYELIRATTADFDQALEANVRQHLANWLR